MCYIITCTSKSFLKNQIHMIHKFYICNIWRRFSLLYFWFKKLKCEFDFFFSRTNLTSSVCSTVHYHHYNTPRTNTRTNRQELVYYYSVLKLLLDGHPPSPRGCWRPPRTTTVVLGWGRAKTYRTASICTTFNVLFPSASGLVLIVKTILISYKNIRIWFVPHIASRWIW